MRFNKKKIFVNDFTIRWTPEVKAARFPLSDARLLKLLISNDYEDDASSDEQRKMAREILDMRGFMFGKKGD